MNIFVVSCCPFESAKLLPENHIKKMAIETCQMIAVIYSPWFHNWGEIPKKDGTPYKTKKGSFRGHPCTIWASESDANLAWLITHGLAICDEFKRIYQKKHACLNTLKVAEDIFKERTLKTLDVWREVKSFVRAMPDEIKYDTEIDTIQAYRKYMNTKEWVSGDYTRAPERKPSWII